MSLAEDFAIYLKATLGTTEVYTSQLPANPESKGGQWAVLAGGGGPPEGGNILKWRRTESLRVMYRHGSAAAMYGADADLRAAVAGFSPTQSTAVGLPAVSPMSDDDKDAEGRHRASWGVDITILVT